MPIPQLLILKVSFMNINICRFSNIFALILPITGLLYKRLSLRMLFAFPTPLLSSLPLCSR